MDGTIGMIDERACSLMKDGAVFLNFSRDSLVDDEAMAGLYRMALCCSGICRGLDDKREMILRL